MQHTFRMRAAMFGGSVALGVALVVAGISGTATMRAQADEATTDGPAVQEVYGQQMQRTPDGAYNTDVLKADQRGCYSCHGNLNELMSCSTCIPSTTPAMV